MANTSTGTTGACRTIAWCSRLAPAPDQGRRVLLGRQRDIHLQARCDRPVRPSADRTRGSKPYRPRHLAHGVNLVSRAFASKVDAQPLMSTTLAVGRTTRVSRLWLSLELWSA